MLDVSLLGVELCSVWKGMRGQWSNDKGKQQMSTPPRPPSLLLGKGGQSIGDTPPDE